MAPDSVIYDTWYIFWYVGFCVDEIVESVRGLHFVRVLFQSLQNGLTSPVAASLTPRTISAFESHIRHHKMFLSNTRHLFPKKQVATKKKYTISDSVFGTVFYAPSHMVWWVLFWLLASEASFWLVKILKQPSRRYILQSWGSLQGPMGPYRPWMICLGH